MAAASLFIVAALSAQNTWTAVTNPVPNRSGGGLMLLSDGSVLCKSADGFPDNIGNMWLKLTPDMNGSYLNGTWSHIAPMHDSRLYFSSQLLKDGRLYVAGGEYGSGYTTAEMYDPLSNTWSTLPAPGLPISDANSEMLDDGRVLQAFVTGPSTTIYFYNPVTNLFTAGPSTHFSHNESSWVKLKDGSILYVGTLSTSSERYIPSLNQWVADATVPVALYDNFGAETGAALLLPDGRAFFLGSTGNTAIYTPSGNNSPGSWVAGPVIPGAKGCPDAPAAMMADGKIFLTASNSPTSLNTLFTAPTYFFEYDYTSNTFSQVPAFNGNTLADTAFNTTMIDLPDGNVLMSEAFTKNFYIHKPAGPPLAAGKPTITSVSQMSCNGVYKLTGLLFNGISEGAYYGDDWQMNTNYPIVRLHSGTNVYYTRSHHWSHTGVQRGSLPDTTLFDVPGTVPAGIYSLVVVANGISSDPVSFTVSTFPALTSPLIAPLVCSGNLFTYNASVNTSSTAFMWTRPAVAGISNAAILTPQSGNPAETLVNTTSLPISVVYQFTLSSPTCTNYSNMSVVVNTTIAPVIRTTTNTAFCAGKTVTLTAIGLNTHLWSNQAQTNKIVVNPGVTTTYTVGGINNYGCNSSAAITLTVMPVPTLTVSGRDTLCAGESTTLHANTNGITVYWNNIAGDTAHVYTPLQSGKVVVVAMGTNGCRVSDTTDIIVEPCLGINTPGFHENEVIVYPNPTNGRIVLKTNVVKPNQLLMINSQGQEIKRLTLKSNNQEIDVSGISAGIYFISVIGDDRSGWIKLQIVE